MIESFVHLKGCRQHNLKNLSLQIPKNSITVITGVSGSGKSSLAFDTLFAEGQRRYLEYLSPAARSSIKQMPKPDIDIIEGLSPTLAVGQGRQALYAHGTVATYTDLYDFLSLLYVKIGQQYSPFTNQRLVRYSRQEIIELILQNYPPGTRLQLLAPISLKREGFAEALNRLQQMGFVRFKVNDQDWTVDEVLPAEPKSIDVIVDRLEMKEDIRERLSGSIESAMDLSQGILKIQEGKQGAVRYLTEIYVCPASGLTFQPLASQDFNFNSPRGACPTCQGQGGWDHVQADLIDWDQEISWGEQILAFLDHFPRKLSARLEAIWNIFLNHYRLSGEETQSQWPAIAQEEALYGSLESFNVDLDEDSPSAKVATKWKGLIPLLTDALKDRKIKTQLIELPFITWQACPTCHGARLKLESLACLVQGKNIADLCAMTAASLLQEIQSWAFTGKEQVIAQEIIPQLLMRLELLNQVGLGYLELNRQGKTLSDGEIQRIQLASQIGAKLSGILYILDEPSLGLHRQDIHHLQQVIQELKALGNTVILVEHEKGLISQADHVIELGPGAGHGGGYVTFQGSYADLLKDPESLTGQWLSGRLAFFPHSKRRVSQDHIHINQASLHNLKNLSLDIPLGCLVGFCGVSGSGKSTLVLDVIGEQLQQYFSKGLKPRDLSGFQSIHRLVTSHKKIDRFSSRSIPATYVDLMTPLRQLFAETRLAKARGYTASRFSLNKKGGRCEACEGLGAIHVTMQLMPDLLIPCEVCQGLRYNYETLQVTWEGRQMADVLALSVAEALILFANHPTLAPKLQLMQELGLDYLTLGQSFHTLSGGEVQRLRLVADLAKPSLAPTLYLLDEPSAGLHFQDINKLIKILHRLIDQGHSIWMIEHHLDMLKQADWLLELGPGGGPQGGHLIFEGTLKQLLKADTPTSRVLKAV